MKQETRARQEKQVRQLEIDERAAENDVEERKPQIVSLYGEARDHNEWLGVLTSSGLFV